MNLVYQNGLFAINECKVTKIESKKSGNEIQTIEGWIRVGKDKNPQDFSSMDVVDIVDEESGMQNSFTLQVDSTSNSDSWDYWDIKILCVEIEDYIVDELVINDISIKPYEYEEEVDGDALIITLKTEVDKNVFEQLRSAFINQKTDDVVSYFNVQRKGLIDKQMRFGQPIWSENDGSYKIQLIIVESAYDTENTFKGLNEPEFSNMKDMIANLNVMSQKIVNILADKKIINDHEAKGLLSSHDKELSSELFKMKRVRNLDSY